MRRRDYSAPLTGLAAVLLFVGLLAGVVNRQVWDGSQFARHVDAIRRDPAVSRQVGQVLAAQAIASVPDLVALRPLVEVSATALVGSAALSPVVRASAGVLHAAFTDGGSGPVAWRLVDVGAVMSGVLQAISPQAASRLPPDLSVTLASVGSRTFAARTIHLARVVRLLSWLLPLLAAICFAVAVGTSPNRRRAWMRGGQAVLGTGIGLGLVAIAGELVASAADESTLRGALTSAAWRQFGRPLWWVAAVTAGAGGVALAVGSGLARPLDLSSVQRTAWHTVITTPNGTWPRIGRALALIAVGLGALLRPRLTLEVAAGVMGLLLFVAGIGELAAIAGAARVATPDLPADENQHRSVRRRRWMSVAGIAVAAVLLIGLVIFQAAPRSAAVPSPAATGGACNGYVQLCDRPYNDVAFVATHNSMSAADEPGWFIPEQPTGLIGQLDAGVRVFLIDVWYGQATTTPGLIATAPGSHAAALEQAEQAFGAAAVTSALRLRDAVTPTATGPVLPYLCHGLCEIGATEWEPQMAEVRAWLNAHPREVVTFFVEDYVSPGDAAQVFRQAGLLPDVYTPQPGQPWPTLGRMINSGHRVVVLMERQGGGKTYPWLQQGFGVVQDTPFSNPTVSSLTCTLNRGSGSNPVFLVNYWLSNNFSSLVSDARTINAYGVIGPYLQRCQAERHHLPNFVAVNFYNLGDVFRAVAALNGLPYRQP